jgi:photosystem II stability/assembly factor-like uncharacterized protein
MALVKVAVCALLITVVVSSSVPLGRNNAPMPAIAHAATTSWSSQSSGTTNELDGVGCASMTICYSVGVTGTIVATTDGGSTWRSQSSGTTNNMNGVACTDTLTCYAVGDAGTILVTTNGGSTWISQTSGTTQILYDIACFPGTSTCYVVGNAGTILVTTNGGSTWTPQTSGTTIKLKGVACPNVNTCYAVSDTSAIVSTKNGGSSWSSQSITPTNKLKEVACTDTLTCYVVGDTGSMIVATKDGGSTWSSQSSGLPALTKLKGVACASTNTCYTVGITGTIVATTDGNTWTPQNSGTTNSLWAVACPSTSICYAVGTSGTILQYGTTLPPQTATATVQPTATATAQQTATAEAHQTATAVAQQTASAQQTATAAAQQTATAAAQLTATAVRAPAELTIALKPTTSQVGTTVAVRGQGFGRHEQVMLALDAATLVTTPSVITTADGTFTARFTLPSYLVRGVITVSAMGTQTRRSAVATLNGRTPVAAQFYFAGGLNTAREHSFVQLRNPNRKPVRVELTFYSSTGATSTTTVNVGPTAQKVIPVAGIKRLSGTFGLYVKANRPISAQLHVTRAGKDDDMLLGAMGLGTTWDLSGGYTGLTVQDRVSILNPAGKTARVQLRLLPVGGHRGTTVQVRVPAHTNAVVDINRLLPHQSLSIIATANRAVLVERTLTVSSKGEA